MLWISGKYVLQITKANENYIFVKTWSIFGFHKIRKFPADMLKTAVYQTGVYKYPNTPVVSAPYSILKTPSGKQLMGGGHP